MPTPCSLPHGAERRGSPDDGTSVSDFEEEEQKRHFSIDTSVLNLEHQGKRINLLDTPGYPDFVGAALGALNAVENVLLTVSAVNGLGVNTRRMAREGSRRGLGCMFVITKIDADNARFLEVVEVLDAENFGKRVAPFNVPIGIGPTCTGVVSVLNPPATRPEGCPIDLAAAHSALIDAVVDSNETLMEKYLAEGDLSLEELNHAVPHALEAGTLIPVFCVSAKKGIGLTELLGRAGRGCPEPDRGPAPQPHPPGSRGFWRDKDGRVDQRPLGRVPRAGVQGGGR